MADRADIRELKKTETLPGSVLQVDIPGSTVKQKEAAKIIRETAVDNNPRRATEQLAVPTAEIPSLAKLKYAIDRNIYFKANEATGTRDRTPDEVSRLNRATKAAENAHYILEKGYQNLPESDAGQPIDKERIRRLVLPEIKRLWPDLQASFGTMTLPAQEKALESLLADDRFQKNLLQVINRLEGESVDSLDKEAYNAAKDALEEAQRRYREADREHTETVNEKNRFTTGGDRFTEVDTLPPLSVLRSNLGVLEGDLATLKSDKAVKEGDITYERTLASTRGIDPDERKNALTRMGDARRDLTRIQGNIATKERDIAEVKRKIALWEEFERDKKAAEEAEKQAQKTLDQATIDRDKAEKNKFKMQANFDLNQLNRAANEEVYVTRWEKAVAEAAENVLTTRLRQDEEARDQLLEKAGNKELAEGIRKRWVRADGSYDKNAVEADFDKFIADRLDDVVLDTLMVEGKMNRAEAQHKLATDENFANEARRKVAERLLTRYLQTGHKLNENEINYIMDSDIGKEVITNALNNRKKYNDQLEELKRQNIVPKDWNWRNVLDNLPKPTARQLMYLALGSAGVFFTAPYLAGLIAPAAKAAYGTWQTLFSTGQLPTYSVNNPLK